MKCLKNVETNEIKRVRDDFAEKVTTNSGLYIYCPKSEWKALRTTPVAVVAHSDEQTREIQRKVEKKKMQQGKRNYKK